MDYRLLEKRLDMPAGFSPPRRLVREDIVATAITRADLEDDVRGINASLALIRRTRGGTWPSEPVTEEFNFVDLVWHELEFRERYSFTYVLRTTEGGYLGCCYLYPMGRRTALTEDLARHDVDVSWWVTPSAYEAGYYAKSHRALRQWLAAEYPFWSAYFSNREIPDE
jgi:RimJ/RimL family protein N-acetyltransferase